MILACLRASTHEAHERLEARIDILEQVRSRSAYRALLERFHGFYIPIEVELAEAAAQWLPEFDFTRRRKSQLLENDLWHLGASAEEISRLPVCGALPAATSASEALGCLYVMEGATLGGKIISRHIKEALHLDEGNGAAFFNGYGSETGVLWRAFGEMVVCRAHAGAEHEAILKSAAETFRAFEAWFSQGDNPHE